MAGLHENFEFSFLYSLIFCIYQQHIEICSRQKFPVVVYGHEYVATSDSTIMNLKDFCRFTRIHVCVVKYCSPPLAISQSIFVSRSFSRHRSLADVVGAANTISSSFD